MRCRYDQLWGGLEFGYSAFEGGHVQPEHGVWYLARVVDYDEETAQLKVGVRWGEGGQGASRGGMR